MERFETMDNLANANLEELTAFIDETGRNFANPAAKAKAIRVAARDSYRLPITVNHAMAVSIDSMQAFHRHYSSTYDTCRLMTRYTIPTTTAIIAK